MARHRGPVLADTNAILECHRVGAWKALVGGYSVETVEDCVTETQTGFQRRRAAEQIDSAALRASLAAVRTVAHPELAVVALLEIEHGVALDVGEKSLWAHALARADAWVLCGPDAASLRFGIACGRRDRLVALETLLSDAGHTPRTSLKPHYTAKWHAAKLVELTFAMGTRKP